MDIDLDTAFNSYDEDEAEARRERQLLEDEQPLDFDDSDGCGGACTI